MRRLPGLALLVGLACAAAPPPPAPAGPPPTDAESYYPLTPGWKWAYSVERDGQKILATYAVKQRDGESAVVQAGSEILMYTVNQDGIVRHHENASGDFILKNPVAVGTTWRIGSGEARVVAVGEVVTLEAGRFAPCIVVEERKTQPANIVRTTFAAGVGPIVVESQVQEAGRWTTILRATLLGVTKPDQDFTGATVIPAE